MQNQSKISVAIVGAGVAGITLLHALLAKPHLDVHLYESRSKLTSGGAAIALKSNAIMSLQAISPNLLRALKDAEAVYCSSNFYVARGPHAGQHVVMPTDLASPGILGDDAKVYNVARQSFLLQLSKALPATNMHMNKKLERMERNAAGQHKLYFADQSSATADVVIGSDGIHSRMRGRVLGDQPCAKAEYAGWWYHVSMIPVKAAQHILGSELINPDNPQSHEWIGDNGTFTSHAFVTGGKVVQFGVTIRGDGEYDPKDTPPQISREQIMNGYRHWPKQYSVDFINTLCEHSGDPVHCWPLSQHPPAPTYVTDDMALMGDAAHCRYAGSTPWIGSGASMATEDALVMSKVLGHAKTKSDLPTALRAYDETRRPRSQAMAKRVVKASFEAGKLSTGRDPKVGLDKYKVGEALAMTGAFITEYDPVQHCAAALDLMERYNKKT